MLQNFLKFFYNCNCIILKFLKCKFPVYSTSASFHCYIAIYIITQLRLYHIFNFVIVNIKISILTKSPRISPKFFQKATESLPISLLSQPEIKRKLSQ